MSDPTDAEVEWAAKCLHKAGKGDTLPPYYLKGWWGNIARHAINHGYVPPPRPRSVREEIANWLCDRWNDRSKVNMDYAMEFAGEILARFDVRRRDA